MTDVRTLLADKTGCPIVVGYDNKDQPIQIFDLPRCQQSNNWGEINPINGRYADGTPRHTNLGRGLTWTLSIPTAYRSTVAILRDLVTWEDRNPTGYLRLWRHRDQTDDSQKVTIVGDYSDLFADHMPKMHAVAPITFMSLEVTHNIPVGGASTFSSYCEYNTAYPNDLNADCYASVCGVWDWGEYRPGETINFFTATVGAYTLEFQTAAGYTWRELIMRLTGSNKIRYLGLAKADSRISSSIYGKQATGDDEIGLLYRYIDANHFYQLTANCDTGVVTLKINNAGFTTLGTWTATGIAPRTWFDLKAEFTSGTHRIYYRLRELPYTDPPIVRDWVFLGQVTNSAIITAGSGVLYTKALTDAAYKNFELKDSDYYAADEARISHYSPWQRQIPVPWL